jgi:hypothetical protein
MYSTCVQRHFLLQDTLLQLAIKLASRLQAMSSSETFHLSKKFGCCLKNNSLKPVWITSLEASKVD